jgi:uncharacterized membrane protein
LSITPVTGDGRPPPNPQGSAQPSKSGRPLFLIGIPLLVIGAALFIYEQQTFREARGDVNRLKTYLHNCVVCIYKYQAEQEVAGSQISAAGGGQEQNEQQTGQPAPENLNNPPQEVSQLFQFQVCNNGCTPAAVAVSYYSPENSAWVVRGWWTVAGNQCLNLGSFTKGQFYYYAKGIYSDAVEWRGNYGLCVKLPGPFFTINRGLQCGPGQWKQFISQNIQANNYKWSIQSFCE